jgi:hypothetical protein
MNVITVDWSVDNQFPNERAVANTVIAAPVIRQLLGSKTTMNSFNRS